MNNNRLHVAIIDHCQTNQSRNFNPTTDLSVIIILLIKVKHFSLVF